MRPRSSIGRPSAGRSGWPLRVDARQLVGARAGAGGEVVAAEAVPAAAGCGSCRAGCGGAGAGRRRPRRTPARGPRARRTRRRPGTSGGWCRPPGAATATARRGRRGPSGRGTRALASGRDQLLDLLQRVHEPLGGHDAVLEVGDVRRSGDAVAAEDLGLVRPRPRRARAGRRARAARRAGSISAQRRQPVERKATSSGPLARQAGQGRRRGRRAAGPRRRARGPPAGPGAPPARRPGGRARARAPRGSPRRRPATATTATRTASPEGDGTSARAPEATSPPRAARPRARAASRPTGRSRAGPKQPHPARRAPRSRSRASEAAKTSPSRKTPRPAASAVGPMSSRTPSATSAATTARATGRRSPSRTPCSPTTAAKRGMSRSLAAAAQNSRAATSDPEGELHQPSSSGSWTNATAYAPGPAWVPTVGPISVTRSIWRRGRAARDHLLAARR